MLPISIPLSIPGKRRQLPLIPMFPWAVAILLAGLAILDAVTDLRLPHYPVSGFVTLEGAVPQGAEVVFHPVHPHGWAYVSPRGVVRSDGSFELSTCGLRQGAIAGEYLVTVAWTPPTIEGKEIIAGSNQVAARYSEPVTTPLRATVVAGSNHLGRYDLTGDCSKQRDKGVELASLSHH